MSDTPRTDALVQRVQSEEVNFIEAYFQILELARDLERHQPDPATSRKKSTPRRGTSPSARKKPGKANSPSRPNIEPS